ncbi:hypothetical protein [Paeniglutamicibacter sp. Y32M11]|uniref:hypothetical protein n=1 Tax=Paeniglutamicibacter sp. Y32M11 TaxID=2853258 RepID=UPI001C52E444|nr:hypothetical protein [Paeniglutamicibacter sp. Y32M11]QXQ11298.1 hypothetical protein KUF55_05195 [Paeniglutamicibacter sp. Y32M11]
MNNRNEEQAGKERILHGWMAGLLVAGVLFTASPFFVGTLAPILGTDDLGIWRSILTNFGTTLMMAGLLLVVEPKVRRAVSKVVSNAAESMTTSMRQDLLKDVQGDIEERFVSLKERIESALEDGLTSQDMKIADFADDDSYESARSAVGAAAEYMSLHNNEIIVQATDHPGELCIGLRLAIPEELQISEYSGRQEVDPEDKILELVGYTADTPGFSAVEWENTENFENVITKLVGDLERRRAWGRATLVEWDAVHRRLVDGLAVAAKSTRKQPGSLQLKGRLAEIIGTETLWYLTDQSIECPSQDFVLPKSKFPPASFPGNNSLTPVIEQPEWADSQTWDYVIQRGRQEFTFRLY